jgi:hypothetical protein
VALCQEEQQERGAAMKRIPILLVTAMAALLSIAPSARAAFGVEEFSLAFSAADESPQTQAGSHPFEVSNLLRFNKVITPGLEEVPAGALRNLEVELPPGLVGRPTATERCSSTDFIEFDNETKIPKCSNNSVVGVVIAKVHYESEEPATPLKGVRYLGVPVYNLVPPVGVIQRLGFIAVGVPVTLDFKLSEEPPYNVIVALHDVNQTLPILGSRLILWGDPASPAHDAERGSCVGAFEIHNTEEVSTTGESCPVSPGTPDEALVRLSTSCSGSPFAAFQVGSWEGESASGTAPMEATTGCSSLGFGPTISPVPTTSSASSSSGLNFNLDVEDSGLTNPAANSQSDIKRVEVKLPDGFTVNPSIAQGLAACSPADLSRERAGSAPGAGCPQASTIGTVEVESPLLDEPLSGRLYVAKPFENEFNSLLATYMVIKNANLGVMVKQGIHIVANESTGQLTAVADDVPQLPFSHFRLHFRGGDRAPLTTPEACGSYNVDAVMTPWSGGAPVTDTSSFQITSGNGGGSCPTGGKRPFSPGFEAGTLSPVSGLYSPFVLKLNRGSNEAPPRTIETTLPKGLLGKLAGITECSEPQIAAAATRSGPNQGALEIAQPSCPSSSEVGVVNVGAGSGNQTYVQGHVYLAGPYKGAPLSLAIITPAVTGPFDLGAVVVRVALFVDQTSAQIKAVSDPLPTILQGIPLEVRSIALTMNRSNFTLNPTSCEPKLITGTAGSSLGTITALSQYFQVSECGRLKFQPELKLSLSGATKRSGHPALKAVLTYPKKGVYSNIARAQVGLPHSEFLDQGSIGTVCTQPQLKTRTCPKNSIYGRAKAWTPLLAKPISGPVYLGVGYGHTLPDLVAELNGQIRFLLNGRVDTTNQDGLRNTFEAVPDAPVSKFVLELKGGKKFGLLENSENICRKPQHAAAKFVAQNGKPLYLKPTITNDCGKGKK